MSSSPTPTLSSPGPEGSAHPAPCGEGNPFRGRLNSLFFRAMDSYFHRLLGDRKRDLFRELPERVVEVGPGSGSNFRYYRSGTRVVAFEPNPHMHAALAASAEQASIDLALEPRGAEDTGLPDDSVEAVVSTLVLCTVEDPLAALAEIRRILRPGGRFVFLEHVAAPHASWLCRLQHGVSRPWSWVFEGCQVTRDTLSMIEAAGFSAVDGERYQVRTPFLPFNPQIAGVARK